MPGASSPGENNLYLPNIPLIRKWGKWNLLLETLYLLIIGQMENMFIMFKDFIALEFHQNHIFLCKTVSRFGLLKISDWYYSFSEIFYISWVHFISSNICHFLFSLIFVPNFAHLNPISKKELDRARNSNRLF